VTNDKSNIIYMLATQMMTMTQHAACRSHHSLHRLS